MRPFAILLLVVGGASWALGAEQKPQISFELVTKTGVPLTASQDWHQALSGLGLAGLQIRPARPSDEMEIKQDPKSSPPRYRVVGILGADNVLQLPGGKFKLTDTARLRKWLESLGDEGAEGVTAERTTFGFTPRQLADVKDDLKRPLPFSTDGVSASKAVDRIAKKLKFSLELDPLARRELAGIDIADELQGLSSGTALAVILRPAGLVLVPERPRGGQIQYRVAKAEKGRESWPVGWKPKEPPVKQLPELLEFLNVEIHETSVAEAVAAIQARLKAPFLFDRNALAQHGIDPASVQAEVPGKRMTYSQILGRVLIQAKLKFEVRLDEADKPFLWITSAKAEGGRRKDE